MSAKDNANPIVHKPAQSSSTKPTSSSAGDDWWRDEAVHLADPSSSKASLIDHERKDSGVELTDGEIREDIDADEIFGESTGCGSMGHGTQRNMLNFRRSFSREQISFAQSQIPNTP